MVRRVRGMRLVALALVVTLWVAGGPAASAQGLDADIADDIATRGWWDETGSLDETALDRLVADHGPAIGFGYTDRRFAVDSGDGLAATPLLAQSVLDALARTGSTVETVILVTGDEAGGASNEYAYVDVVLALDSVDHGDIVDSFDAIAMQLTEGGIDAEFGTGGDVEPEDRPVFTTGRLILLTAIAAGAFVLFRTYRSRRRTVRTESTADARTDTAAQLTAMSDLILDLEPRITIADDQGLSERFAAASRTYSEVLEAAGAAVTGHEIADLRIEIAKARWKLDVIEAELDGAPAPPEPFRFGSSGSAWDSTRGTGAS